MDLQSLLLALAIVALFYQMRRISVFKGKIEDLDSQVVLLQSRLEKLPEELGESFDTLKLHVAALAQGLELDKEQVLAGRPYRDITAAAAQEWHGEGDKVLILDVRSMEEYLQGHIPGATLIPIDQLESRHKEIPAGHEKIVVHCAAGGRSVAACQILAAKGFTDLYNMPEGMGAWKGPVESGNPVRS
jgi:rhodanese-related sulfurtransferase